MTSMPHAPEATATRLSDLEEAIRELEMEALAEPTEALPQHRALGSIRQERTVFQVRGGELKEYHLSALRKALTTTADLQPILVLLCVGGPVLVDGHHRVEAYRRAGRPTVPVEVFRGTVREAVLEAALRNTSSKLTMDNQERSDCAWRLDGSGYSRADTITATGVSRSLIGIMRKARKALGDGAADFTEWWRARRAWQGGAVVQLTDDERDAMIKAQAQDYADRLSNTFGNRLAKNPEITALALAIHLGRKLPDLAGFIGNQLNAEDFAYIKAEFGAEEDFY